MSVEKGTFLLSNRLFSMLLDATTYVTIETQTSRGSLHAICITTPYMPLFRQVKIIYLEELSITFKEITLRLKA